MIREFEKVIVLSGALALVPLPLFTVRKEDADQPHTHQHFEYINWTAMKVEASAQSTATIATTYAGPASGSTAPFFPIL